jgi:hypothetical protein
MTLKLELHLPCLHLPLVLVAQTREEIRSRHHCKSAKSGPAKSNNMNIVRNRGPLVVVKAGLRLGRDKPPRRLMHIGGFPNPKK